MKRLWKGTGLLLMACSLCFLIERSTTSQGVAPPTMGRVLQNQSPIKKMPYRLTAAQSYRGIFLIEVSFSQMTSSCHRTVQNSYSFELPLGLLAATITIIGEDIVH